MKKKALLIIAALTMSAMVFGCKSNLPADNGNKDGNVSKEETQKPEETETPKEEAPAETPEETPAQGGTYKTGFAVVASAGSSADAGEKDGVAQVDNLLAAVIVDADGKIVNCMIDSVQTVMNFSKDGKIVTPLDTQFLSKNELGEDYGMKKASPIGKEWNEQADAFAKYVVGKTVDEVKGIAVTEGKPTDADLAASVTIRIGDFQKVVEKAVANSVDSAATATDKIGIGTEVNMAKSKDAAADADGLCQSYGTFAAVTFGADGKITSCVIDALQGNVNFDTTGKVTSDIGAEIKTKNELGAEYGMKQASKIGKEWNEQAAAFATYTTGKTADEVKGMAVAEGKPTDADLAASVTVSVGGFQQIIAEAAACAK